MLPFKIRTINALCSPLQFGKRPIAVLGHGRSGTTWIGNTLSEAYGVLQYHEPCNPYDSFEAEEKSKLWFKYLLPNEKNEYFEQQLNGAFKGLIDKHSSVWFQNRKNLLHRLTPGYQLLVKDVAMVMSLDWIRERFNPKMLFVARHPCSVILSEHKRSIDSALSLKLILQSENVQNLLSKKEMEIAQNATHAYEQYAAIWAIRNKPFSLIQKGDSPIPYVSYEELAKDPVEGFKSLFEQLDLKWTATIENHIISTTQKEEPGHYKTVKKATDHIAKWRSIMSAEEIALVKKTVLPFELGMYDRDEDYVK